MKRLIAVLATAGMTACVDPADLPGATTDALPSIPPTPVVAPTPTGTDIPTLPPCDMPPKIKLPKWIPDDLPLPKGTYAMQRLDQLAGYKRALLTIPVVLDDLISFVLDRWPKKGWVLGTGDVEPGEVEDQFSRGKAIGAFKAQSVFCDPGYTVMYLIYAKDGPEAPQAPGIPSPQGSPLIGSPTPPG